MFSGWPKSLLPGGLAKVHKPERQELPGSTLKADLAAKISHVYEATGSNLTPAHQAGRAGRNPSASTCPASPRASHWKAFPGRPNAQGADANHPFMPLFGDQSHSRGALGAQRTNYDFDGRDRRTEALDDQRLSYGLIHCFPAITVMPFATARPMDKQKFHRCLSF